MKTLYWSLLLSLTIAFPGIAYETRYGSVSVQATWGALYDSNLLKYASGDRDRYLNETESHRSPIRALDDLRTDYKLSAELRNKFFNKRTTSLRLTTNFAHHAMNPIKNLGWLSFTVRQDITKELTGSFNYFFEPRFYIRDYIDSHTGIHRHCEFGLNQAKADITYRIKGISDVTGSVKYKDYNYNEYFTEYDGNTLGLGFGVVVRPGKWRISAGYSFEQFENTGFSSSDLVPENSGLTDSEFGQGDFDEDLFTGTVRYSFIALRHESSLQYGIERNKRAFTTKRDHLIDAMHSGREDLLVEQTISLSSTLTRQLGFELGLSSQTRDSEATDIKVSPLKDFKRSTIWIEFTYELK